MTKKLVIHNIGPIRHVELALKRVNVIIGPQSVGKSCVLKLACFSAWLEKQLELFQSTTLPEEKGFWEENLMDFHKLNGFVKKGQGAYFGYSTNSMAFSYHFDTQSFDFKWKQAGRWKYSRNRISYIPAERNIVGVVPNWLDVDLPENNVKNFISDWSKTRQSHSSTRRLDILDLGVSYYYDQSSGRDVVGIGNDGNLSFSESSSGLQSLIPMWVYLDYLFDKQYNQKSFSSINNSLDNDFVLMNIYAAKFRRGVQNKVKNGSAYYEKIGKVTLPFVSSENAQECKRLFENYTKTFSSDIYLEEPEQNLFPQTQVKFIYELLKNAAKHNDSIFLATHSPYILYALNNCMLGYLVKESLPPEDPLKKDAESWINPKEVSVWELRDGMLSSEQTNNIANPTLQDEDGLIRGNYFDRIMHNVMADFTNYSSFL